MHIRKLRRSTFTELYVTAFADPALAPLEAAEKAFAQLAAAVADQRILPLQEKVYGSVTARDEVLALRGKALVDAGLDTSMACTYLDGRRTTPVAFRGVQLWGVVPTSDHVSVKTVPTPRDGRARLLEAPGLELIHIPAVMGTDRDGNLPRGVTAQGDRMFENAEASLAANGFAYTDVARTWIYLQRILDWYGELNNVRTRFHSARGITGRPDAPFPASTGIQGTCAGEECVMDVLAIKTSDESTANIAPLTLSKRQNPSLEYGSAFSRGMTLDIEGQKTILVSGTASICTAGRSLHIDDRQGQIVETLLNIAALIESEGASLADICSGTFFYKDEETLRAYGEVKRMMGNLDLPLVNILADVCRPELLIEIEAVVQVPKAVP